MKRVSALTLAAFMLAACTNYESQAGYQDDTYAPVAEYEVIPSTKRSIDNNEIERKLIKQGVLRFETDNLQSTHQRIVALVQKSGGYLAGDAEEKGYDRIIHQLTVRIPANQFDSFLAEVSSGVAHFDEKRIEVSDVTESYVDLEARINTKKELEKRYLQLLEKANTVEDMLSIEREMANLRSDIESLEGRFRVMNNQIAYATLEISYYVKELEATHGNGYKIQRALKDGLDGLLGFFIGLISIWPLLIFFSLLTWFIIRRFKRKRG